MWWCFCSFQVHASAAHPGREVKLEGFFAHFSLGQIIVVPEALSHEGFFPVSAHCNAQFGGHRLYPVPLRESIHFLQGRL
jgi:hypothetical protein